MKRMIVIGGGPGGYSAAIRGAQLGASVTLIEKEHLGGTCLNRGCIPTKTLYRTATLMHDLKHADRYAIEVETPTVDGLALKNRQDTVVNQLRAGIHQLIDANSIEYVNGTATMVDVNTVDVFTDDGVYSRHHAEYIVLATGSTPITFDFPGNDLPGIYTSDGFLTLDHIPERIAIIGDGVISVEFATIYAALGSKVDLIARTPNVLVTLDHEISKRFGVSLRKKGVNLLVNTTLKEAKRANGNQVELTYESPKGTNQSIYDACLIAIGRKPVCAGLGLESVGVDHTPQGIVVKDSYQTTVTNIYAIGDCIGGMMLAHRAAHQGITAVEHLMDMEPDLVEPPIPGCIFTFPEIATVGITEEDARKQHLDYEVSKFNFAASGKATAMGETEGFVKIIADSEGQLLGAHIMGPHASDMIHEACIALANKMKASDFKHIVYAHPTLSEAVYEAILGIEKEAIHMAPHKIDSTNTKPHLKLAQ